MARSSAGVALTIGNFDGVHLGHAELLRRARAWAGERVAGGRVVAMVFDPHPLAVLRPEAEPARLSTFEQRSRWLAALGVDEVVRLDPAPQLLGLSPEEFIASIVARHTPVAIVEGPDFRFGRGRAGDVRRLAQLGQQHGFEAVIARHVEATLSDETIVPISSSLVRWLVSQGRAKDASLLLGRPYEVAGVVVRGDQRGRTIGCPTANLSVTQLLPSDGVYAGVGELPDGRVFPGAISVGTKPTFDGVERACEAHLVGWEGPLAEGSPEYGWPLRLRIGAWIRDQVKYDGVDPLLEQIARDVRRTVLWFESHTSSAAPVAMETNA